MPCQKYMSKYLAEVLRLGLGLEIKTSTIKVLNNLYKNSLKMQLWFKVRNNEWIIRQTKVFQAEILSIFRRLHLHLDLFMYRISDAWLHFGIFDNILTIFKDTKGLNISEKQSWWQSSTGQLIFMGNFNEVIILGVVALWGDYRDIPTDQVVRIIKSHFFLVKIFIGLIKTFQNLLTFCFINSLKQNF